MRNLCLESSCCFLHIVAKMRNVRRAEVPKYGCGTLDGDDSSVIQHRLFQPQPLMVLSRLALTAEEQLILSAPSLYHATGSISPAKKSQVATLACSQAQHDVKEKYPPAQRLAGRPTIARLRPLLTKSRR